MPRAGPRKRLELGKSVIEFRLTAADADIRDLLEGEGNLSATIRKALRLYALYRSGGVIPAGSHSYGQRQEVTVGVPAAERVSDLAEDLLGSIDADWD